MNASTKPSVPAKDLTREVPRGPRVKIGDYILMARMIDKGRAVLAGLNGEYHFDCPLDNMLFQFKGVKGDEVRELLASGATDEEILAWFENHGTRRTPDDVRRWASESERVSFHGHPEKGEWFDDECRRLGLDPAKTTLFEYLEADDRASYAR